MIRAAIIITRYFMESPLCYDIAWHVNDGGLPL
jgi:hypothetical protein